MSPKLSFVLPTFNRIAWMPECLQSLRSQDVQDIEIIVVNDNSDDGTKEFLDSFCAVDPRIKVHHNEQNLGAGKSRNIGAGLATAPIICVCDDDDIYPTERASMTLKWFEEHPESELVNFPYASIGYFNEIIEAFEGAPFDVDAFKENGSVSYFCNPSCAYKKAAALEMGGYMPEKPGLTDDRQFIQNWISAGKKIDFCAEGYGCLHRVLPNSMMVGHRGWTPKWVGQ